MEFFKYRNGLEPGKGRLLISEPFLPDPNFERTIVLLCEHNNDGSFGFILNKPSEVKLGDVMQELKAYDVPLYVGGPVQQDTLHFIHTDADLEDSTPIVDGVYWGGNFESLLIKLETYQTKISEVKFFLGYSGWGTGQLNEELKADSWIVSDKLNAELLFDTNPGAMWQTVLKNMGGRFSMYSNYPVDPSLN